MERNITIMIKPEHTPPLLWLDPGKKMWGFYCLHLCYEASTDYKNNNPDLVIKSFKTNKGREHTHLVVIQAVAGGVTAFLAQYLTLEEQEEIEYCDRRDHFSLLQKIRYRQDYDIYEWYERYWSIQFSFAEKLNNRKTISQGHLSPQELPNTFYREHLKNEEDYIKYSEGFYKIPFYPYKGPEHREVFREIALNYLQWVKDTHKPDGLQVEGGSSAFICILAEGRLNKICDNLVKYELIPKNDKQAFLALFSSDEKQKIRWNDKIRGAKVALFDLMYRITGKKCNPVHLKPYFETKDKIHDNWRNFTDAEDSPPIPTRLIDQVFNT